MPKSDEKLKPCKRHRWFRRRVSVDCCDLRPGALNWLIPDFDIDICYKCNKTKNRTNPSQTLFR
jgi:hypothetical protein